MRKLITALGIVAFLCGGAPAAAQDFFEWGELTDRNAGTVLQVYDPDSDTYRFITFENLLADLVTFPDTLTRYVAIADGDAARPVFTAADMMAGSSGVGRATGIPVPDYGTFDYIWIALAVPESAGAQAFIGQGATNTGINFISSYEQQADVILGGATYDVWVTVDEWNTEFLANFHIYLTNTATPTPTP